MGKKINSKLYTFTKIVFDKNGLHYEDLENNCLFSNLRYPTKITPEDLPEWFVKGRFYKNHGYLSAKGVVDLVYKPNMWINHMFRDDSLYISYNKQIVGYEEESFGRMRTEYKDYDYVIDGTYAVEFVAAVKKYSDFDTTEIEKAMIEKAYYFAEKFPLVHESYNIERTVKYMKENFAGTYEFKPDYRLYGGIEK